MARRERSGLRGTWNGLGGHPAAAFAALVALSPLVPACGPSGGSSAEHDFEFDRRFGDEPEPPRAPSPTSGTAESTDPDPGPVITQPDPDGPPRPVFEPLGVGTGATGVPPAISGGHVDVSGWGTWIVAADPDRDLVHRWDISRDALSTTELEPGSEPGRALIRDDGTVVVALRQRGELALLDAEGAVARRVPVCAAPRGLAWQARATSLTVLVACADGDLVGVDVETGEVTHRQTLGPDLRDVVSTPDGIFVSTFRAAKVFWISNQGTQTIELAEGLGDLQTVDPTVSWRMRPLADRAGVAVVHQLAQPGVADERAQSQNTDRAVAIEEGGSGGTPGSGSNSMRTYGSTPRGQVATPRATDGPPPVVPDCIGTVASAITEIRVDTAETADPEPFTTALPGVALPVDFASVDGQWVVADAVFRRRNADRRPGLLRIEQPVAAKAAFCTDQIAGQVAVDRDVRPYVAVEPHPDGGLVAMALEPPSLLHLAPDGAVLREAALVDAPIDAPGFELFHADVGVGVACASCHPEGMDDGVAWNLEGTGLRRTHYLRGGLRHTEPFHWAGDMVDFQMLMEVTMGARMGAGVISLEDSTAVFRWLEELPLFPTERPGHVDAEAAAARARGEALFVERGCVGCHLGSHLGGAGRYDVRALVDIPLEVPRLTNLRYRAPYLHDGCAEALDDIRRHSCGGPDHGAAATLTADEAADLFRYLEVQ